MANKEREHPHGADGTQEIKDIEIQTMNERVQRKCEAVSVRVQKEAEEEVMGVVWSDY